MPLFFHVADSRIADDIVTARRLMAPSVLRFCSIQIKTNGTRRIFNLTAERFSQSVAADFTTSALLPVA
jgi:hypothetical protein